jgi:type II secretory pathway component PulF
VESLLQAADHLNKQASLKRKLITALIYPLLTILVTLVVGGGIMFYVFPKILPVIESLNIPLPWTTRTLIAIHNFLDHYSLALIVAIIILAIIVRALYRHTKKFRYHTDRLILFTPLFGKLLKNYELATITRHLGLLIKSGETLSGAWAITAKNIANSYLAGIADGFNQPLKAGLTLSSLWQKYPRIFPPTLTQFIGISERSGVLGKSLTELADRLENNVDHITKTASSLVEPLLMTIIGLSIGFLALAILSPIYEITAHLNR